MRPNDTNAFTDQWVVAYYIDSIMGTELFELYRGTRKECERIVAHSAAPNSTFAGLEVIGFRATAGPALLWEEYMKEIEQAHGSKI